MARDLATKIDKEQGSAYLGAVMGLKNVPKKGVYNWEPGAPFGVYGPDTFWFK